MSMVPHTVQQVYLHVFPLQQAFNHYNVSSSIGAPVLFCVPSFLENINKFIILAPTIVAHLLLYGSLHCQSLLGEIRVSPLLPDTVYQYTQIPHVYLSDSFLCRNMQCSGSVFHCVCTQFHIVTSTIKPDFCLPSVETVS